MLSLDSKNRILDEVAYMAATGNLFFVTEGEEAETQQRSEDFILGDYTVTSLLEYRSLQQMGVEVFFDILPGLTRTFSPRKRAKNCKKGIACGNTCIAKNRVCKQNLPPAVAAQVPPAKAKTKKAAGGATTAPAAPAAPSAPAPAPDPADLLFGLKKPKKPKAPTSQSASSSDSASPSVSSSEFKPNGIYTQEKYDSLNTEHKKRLFRIASGGGDDRPADEQKKGDTALNKFNNANYYQSKKREKILKDNPDLTKAEANAVAHWINHEYQTVNKSIYAPDSLSLKDKTLGEAAAIRLSQGIRKMPPVTAQEVTKQAALRGRQAELAKDGKLRRHVKNLPDVDAFLAPYIQAQKSRQAHIEPTVFATTARNNHGFGDGAQVTFEIKAKMDGTGAGRTVDQYKTKAWEAEVLYPASTGFKVNKIKKEAGITIVELEEI